MRISINWLRELVPIDRSLEELAELLTIAGIEVEEIEERREWGRCRADCRSLESIRAGRMEANYPTNRLEVQRCFEENDGSIG